MIDGTGPLPAVRGALLGLVLGDAIGAAGGAPPPGALPATSAGQLACFTVDGIIRASQRWRRGVCHPPSVVWHAYTRWAAGQNIQGIRRWREYGWPDGWLAGVTELRIPRGRAPATVAALQGGTMGTADRPATESLGAHALTRGLPVGLTVWWESDPAPFGRQIAALTHAAAAADLAAAGTVLLARLAQGHPIEEAAGLAVSECGKHVERSAEPLLTEALTTAAAHPRDPERLRRLAPDRRAESALTGGVYVAASCGDPAEVPDALAFGAGASPDVAAVAGALLGAAWGVDALPADLVTRPELGQVMDELAQDLVREFTHSPANDRQTIVARQDRYPGW